MDIGWDDLPEIPINNGDGTSESYAILPHELRKLALMSKLSAPRTWDN